MTHTLDEMKIKEKKLMMKIAFLTRKSRSIRRLIAKSISFFL